MGLSNDDQELAFSNTFKVISSSFSDLNKWKILFTIHEKHMVPYKIHKSKWTTNFKFDENKEKKNYYINIVE